MTSILLVNSAAGFIIVGACLFLTQRRKEGGSPPELQLCQPSSARCSAASAQLMIIFFTAGHVASMHAVTVPTQVLARCLDLLPLEANGIPLAIPVFTAYTRARASRSWVTVTFFLQKNDPGRHKRRELSGRCGAHI